MFKKVLLKVLSVVFLSLITSNLFAGGFAGSGAVYADSTWVTVLSSVQVYGTAVVLSDPIEITNFKSFGYWITIHGSTHTSVDVKLEYQVTDYTGSRLVQTTKTSTRSWSVDSGSVTWQTPVTNSSLDSSILDSGGSSNLFQTDAFVPMTTKYLRFRVTGNATNDPISYITLKAFRYGNK